VQGEQAPDSIVKAIGRVVQDGRAEVLILSRGGGAVEELACFNDERVVRAIANCGIPVIAGIGHQRDESLADLAADASVHTPTAAAEMVVPSLQHLYSQHRQRLLVLENCSRQRFVDAEKGLLSLQNRLQRLRLDRQVEQQVQSLSSKRQRLVLLTMGKLQQAKQHVDLLQQKLATLDPKAVLQRGYAVVRQENGLIARNAAELELGQILLVQLGEGDCKVKVISTEDTF
jgi:exodeoxyribonuclease VII large subunit